MKRAFPVPTLSRLYGDGDWLSDSTAVARERQLKCSAAAAAQASAASCGENILTASPPDKQPARSTIQKYLFIRDEL